MLIYFQPRIRWHVGNNPFFSTFSTFRKPRTNFSPTKTLSLKMGIESNSKRPMCQSCSKPARICLCNRMKTPILENSVAVTILQHRLEKNHPLNSTRIATLGLNNLNVHWVSDVNFEAQFDIHLLQPNLGMDTANSLEKNDLLVNYRYGRFSEHPEDRSNSCISFGIKKYGAVSSFNNQLVLSNGKQTLGFDHLLASLVPPINDLEKGFIVKKLQKRQLNGDIVFEDREEFELEVPAGSVLLFPSEDSIGVEEIYFEVKNLIVLDGTWAKARRIYNENPWLKVLPHLKLDSDKLSLYGEVRNQPQGGYLSTIESIVYALKALGEESEGLDGLLDVFESMVGDQRRCKDERLSKAADFV